MFCSVIMKQLYTIANWTCDCNACNTAQLIVIGVKLSLALSVTADWKSAHFIGNPLKIIKETALAVSLLYPLGWHRSSPVLSAAPSSCFASSNSSPTKLKGFSNALCSLRCCASARSTRLILFDYAMEDSVETFEIKNQRNHIFSVGEIWRYY